MNPIRASERQADLVLVHDDSPSISRAVFIANMKNLGLDIYQEKVQDSIFLLVTIPADLLSEAVKLVNYGLPFKEYQVDNEEFGKPFLFSLAGLNELTSKFIYARTDSSFPTTSDQIQSMTSRDRSILAYEILSRLGYKEEVKNPCDILEDMHFAENSSIVKLIEEKALWTVFQLHEKYVSSQMYSMLDVNQLNDREFLWEYWAGINRVHKKQPIQLICKYLGEKQAYCFAFLEFFSHWLRLPALAGFVALLICVMLVHFDVPTGEICKENPIENITRNICSCLDCNEWKLTEMCHFSKLGVLMDSELAIVFSLIISIWAAAFVEFGKRKVMILNFELNISSPKEKRRVYKPNHVLKNRLLAKIFQAFGDFLDKNVFFSQLKSLVTALLGVCGIALGLVAFILIQSVIREKIRLDFDAFVTTTLEAGISAFVYVFGIDVLGEFYKWTVIRIYSKPKHHDSTYEKSIVTNMICFKFMSLVSPIIYILFFKNDIMSTIVFQADLNQRTMRSQHLMEACVHIFVFLNCSSVIQNISKTIIPWIKFILKSWRLSELGENRWINDFKLLEQDQFFELDEYSNIVIQFGFITLFTIMSPLAALLALLGNLIGMRISAKNSIVYFRRPLARQVHEISIWLNIMKAISYLGIMMNAFLLAFYSDIIPRQLYKSAQGKGKLDGYNQIFYKPEILVSASATSPQQMCYKKEFNYPGYISDEEWTTTHFIILAARLSFLIIYEHSVILAAEFICWIIPDVSSTIQEHKEYEEEVLSKAAKSWVEPTPEPVVDQTVRDAEHCENDQAVDRMLDILDTT